MMAFVVVLVVAVMVMAIVVMAVVAPMVRRTTGWMDEQLDKETTARERVREEGQGGRDRGNKVKCSSKVLKLCRLNRNM